MEISVEQQSCSYVWALWAIVLPDRQAQSWTIYSTVHIQSFRNQTLHARPHSHSRQTDGRLVSSYCLFWKTLSSQ